MKIRLVPEIYNTKIRIISGIYKITNVVNDKYYVGSSKDIYKRLEQHIRNLRLSKHCNQKLQHAWNKYSEQRFIFEIIEECEIQKLYEREQYYLDLNVNGYNIGRTASGGDNLTSHPNRIEIIKKITNTIHAKYENYTREDIERIFGNRSGENNANYGNRWNDEQRKRASEQKNDYFKTHAHVKKGKTHVEYFGKERAELINKKLSEHAKKRTGEKNSFYGKKHKPETLKKISDANKGNIPKNRRPFTINGIMYTGLYDAEKKLGISYSVIQYRLNSKNPKFSEYRYCD